MIGSVADHRAHIPYESPDLALFAKAANWKAYWSGAIRPFIGVRVIEVGAGLGYSTEHMCRGHEHEWCCLDPDPTHVAYLNKRIVDGELPPICKAERGTLADLPIRSGIDTIIYADVLEHIEDDESEMRVAAAHLKTDGHVIVISPAFQFLFSPFDSAVGHYRRYEKHDAKRLTVSGLALHRMFYLDSIGFFLSLMNRLLMRAQMPTAGQIAFWDGMVIPLSKLADHALKSAFGRSIVMIWRKIA